MAGVRPERAHLGTEASKEDTDVVLALAWLVHLHRRRSPNAVPESANLASEERLADPQQSLQARDERGNQIRRCSQTFRRRDLSLSRALAERSVALPLSEFFRASCKHVRSLEKPLRQASS